VASALAWWHEAGVDTLVGDAARNWFEVSPPPSAVIPSAPVAAATPMDAPGFLAWRSGADAPEAGWRAPLAMPIGPDDARLMVLVDCPDQADGAALLSGGPVARMFDRMLAAIGFSRDTVHIAATYWRRPPPGRLPPAADERVAELARRYVSLIAPTRLLLLGDAASRSILGTNILAARGGLRPLNHEQRKTEVIASFHPRLLLERPATKAEAWRDLRLLIGGMDG